MNLPKTNLTNEKIDECTFGISFAVTTEQMQQSKDGKIFDYMTKEYSRTLGEHIGNVKPWSMTPMAEDKMLIKQLEVVVFTPKELAHLIHQAEIEAKLDSLRWAEHNSNDVNFSIADRIEALEKEIV